MSEFDSGALCFRALVEEKPQATEVNGEIISLKLRVSYHHKSAFSVDVPRDSRFFSSLLEFRPGDEMWVSRDGEDITSIKRNSFWKRPWLLLTW